MKATRSPAVTVKSAYVRRSRPCIGTCGTLRSHTESGPAIATRWPSVRRIHGTTLP
jgi:hypothetical protein